MRSSHNKSDANDEFLSSPRYRVNSVEGGTLGSMIVDDSSCSEKVATTTYAFPGYSTISCSYNASTSAVSSGPSRRVVGICISAPLMESWILSDFA
ncbi:hypothetical protein B0O99DRAFT_617435 [Bisporella sp. PMI_857]|nr:hypothetical protein B0O99DRAFT_617435 [Bisporella sp. PMI_857]